MKDDLISRQAAIDAVQKYKCEHGYDYYDCACEVERDLRSLPSAQSEPHYCRECKWSMCHINVDKHGSETYWRCLNWDGETDEEGYCHEWERRTE